MKTRICIAAVLAVVVLPLAMNATVDLSELLNPDDVMLRKPVQKTHATVDKTAAEKAAAAAKAAAEKAAAAKAAVEKAAAERAAAAAKAEADRRAAEKAAADAELKRLREQVEAEKAARARAEAEKAAAEAKVAEERRAVEAATEKAARAERRAAYLANPDPDERTTPKKLVATGDAKDVAGAVGAEMPVVAVKKAGAKKPKKELTGRPAVITADRTDYDRKEGVILFDRGVYVDDEQYQMHADRLFVFLDGTNDMKRLVALGNVSLTNEDKTAWCQKAVYTKAASKIVLFGDEQNPAWLRDAGSRKGDESEVRGLRITYWIDSGLATVEKSVITLPGFGGSKNPRDLFSPGSDKKKKKDE